MSRPTWQSLGYDNCRARRKKGLEAGEASLAKQNYRDYYYHYYSLILLFYIPDVQTGGGADQLAEISQTTSSSKGLAV